MTTRSITAVAAAGLMATTLVVERGTGVSAAEPGGSPAAAPASAPSFLQCPLPTTGQAYRAIDGARLWQHVKESGDIAERYRQQGHPQFRGIIAGTSGDAEEARWLLGK